MIPVKRLRSICTSVHRRSHPHGEADDVLHYEREQRQQSKDGMRRGEMRPFHLRHGDFHDGETSDEGNERSEVERRVDVLASALAVKIFGRDGLLDKDGLGEDENGRGHGDRVAREEDDGGGGDACPDAAAEHQDACLREEACFGKQSSHDARSLRYNSISMPLKQRFRLGPRETFACQWLLRKTSYTRHCDLSRLWSGARG